MECTLKLAIEFVRVYTVPTQECCHHTVVCLEVPSCPLQPFNSVFIGTFLKQLQLYIGSRLRVSTIYATMEPGKARIRFIRLILPVTVALTVCGVILWGQNARSIPMDLPAPKESCTDELRNYNM